MFVGAKDMLPWSCGEESESSSSSLGSVASHTTFPSQTLVPQETSLCSSSSSSSSSSSIENYASVQPPVFDETEPTSTPTTVESLRAELEAIRNACSAALLKLEKLAEKPVAKAPLFGWPLVAPPRESAPPCKKREVIVLDNPTKKKKRAKKVHAFVNSMECADEMQRLLDLLVVKKSPNPTFKAGIAPVKTIYCLLEVMKMAHDDE